MFNPMELKEEYCELFEAKDWHLSVAVGAFLPYDGTGYWGTETHYDRNTSAFKSQPVDATHVHWYNR